MSHSRFALAWLVLSPFAAAQTPIDATLPNGPPSPPQASVIQAPSGSYQAQWSDDFNRPDAATLGPDWLVQSGSYSIVTNRALSVGSGVQWVKHASASLPPAQTEIACDFFNAQQGPLLVFVAAVIGTGASSDNVFCKIQDNNSDGNYDRVFFYRGINGGSWTASYYFDLLTPTPSGRMKVYLSNNGDVAHLDVDNNFDNVFDEQFQTGGILAAGMNLGTQLGLSTYNSPAVDNWIASDGTPPVIVYCTAKLNSLGCTPSIGSTGTPSSVNNSGFVVSASQVRNQKSGLMFYGFNGQNSAPFQGGTLCVQTPIKRTPAVTSGGTALPTNDCTGVYSIDMNSFAHGLLGGTPSPSLVIPGQVVNCQFWGRDPGFPAPNNTTLSDGLEYTVQ